MDTMTSSQPWAKWLRRVRRRPKHTLLVESVLIFVASVGASLLAAAKVLRVDRVQDDALVHQYWMRSFQDPELFHDSLTRELRSSERYPDAYEGLFRLASEFADPISFGEWLGVALMAISGWLVSRIVREHTPWVPAAWLGAALFLALVDIHRFYGGFPRAFLHPAVLLTVLLALRGRQLSAALVAAGSSFLYPPAALLAVGILVVSAVAWRDGQPRVDRRRAGLATLAVVVMFAAVLGPQLSGGNSADVMTAAQARAYPEFNAHGPLHFFVSSPVRFLKQNRSGFDLRTSGSILALSALLLLVTRPANARLMRVEVFALAVVALGLYTIAHLVLFKLYLPHRYTYPLLAFFAIVVAVTLRPTWQAVGTTRRPRLWSFTLLVAPLVVYLVAVHAFPLGPGRALDGLQEPASIAGIAALVSLAAGAALLITRFAETEMAVLGAVLTGLGLFAALLWQPARPSGTPCRESSLTTYLQTLPKDAVIAGDPVALTCIPLTARRPVVISMKLLPSYEAAYFRETRARMFATLGAYYGPSTRGIVALRRRYGATHLWVRREAVEAEVASPKGVIWKARNQPYGQLVRRLVTAGTPAVLTLPAACRTWNAEGNEIYEIRCLAEKRIRAR